MGKRYLNFVSRQTGLHIMEPRPLMSPILSLLARLHQLQTQSPSGLMPNLANYSKPDGMVRYPSKRRIHGPHLAFRKISSEFAACSLARFGCRSIRKSSSFGLDMTIVTSNAPSSVISSWGLPISTCLLSKGSCQQTSSQACRMVKFIGSLPGQDVPPYVSRHHCPRRPLGLLGSWPKDTERKFANSNRCPSHFGGRPGPSVRDQSSHMVGNDTRSIYIVAFGRWAQAKWGMALNTSSFAS